MLPSWRRSTPATRHSRHRAAREADGPLCRPAHRRASRGRALATAISLSPLGRSRHHRPPRRGGEARSARAHRLPWLAVLERLHIYFLITARHRLIVAFTWLDYVTFQRGARLITQVPLEVSRARPAVDES